MEFIKRWYIYQKERFPILTYGLYVFTIVFATFCINGNTSNYNIMIPMFIVALLQFLMVRIVDEFKDYEDDCKYRPYRPVPRGIVSLNELKVLLIICVILQFIITLTINPRGIIYLFVVWIFFVIMSKEFFIKDFLDRHILVEVLLDEIIMPICVIYISSFIGNINFSKIFIFLILTYVVSWVMEIARKIRSKDQEEKGVKTYTAVYGINKAVLILFIVETLLMLLHLKILGNINIMYVIIPYITVVIIDILFANKQTKSLAKLVELMADLYVFVVYLSMSLLVL